MLGNTECVHNICVDWSGISMTQYRFCVCVLRMEFNELHTITKSTYPKLGSDYLTLGDDFLREAHSSH